MLEAKGLAYRYREYTQEPLSASELTRLFELLGLPPRALLRRRDAAFKSLGLTGDEADEVLIGHMAEHPTLLQRPIGVCGDKATVGRPVENLLSLA